MFTLAGTTRWIAPAALIFSAGCLGVHPDQTQLQFNEIPPAVRSAFIANYRSNAIRGITCQAQGGQYYYSLTYADSSGAHTVVLNEGGDEINRY